MIEEVILLSVLALAVSLQSNDSKAGYAFRMLPKKRMRRGSKVCIYIDGQFNRCATITGITGDSIIFYGRIFAPLSFRGRFYATGIDMIDGSRFVYVMCRRHYWLVRIADFFAQMV